MGLVLQVHSVLRWVLLIAAALIVVKALVGWLARQRYTTLDDRLGLGFTIVVDVQVLVGLILWLFGPVNVADLGGAMSNPAMRFLLLEHPFLMIIALAFAHIGRARMKRATDDVVKHRTSFIFFLLSLIFIGLIFVLQGMLA